MLLNQKQQKKLALAKVCFATSAGPTEIDVCNKRDQVFDVINNAMAAGGTCVLEGVYSKNVIDPSDFLGGFTVIDLEAARAKNEIHDEADAIGLYEVISSDLVQKVQTFKALLDQLKIEAEKELKRVDNEENFLEAFSAWVDEYCENSGANDVAKVTVMQFKNYVIEQLKGSNYKLPGEEEDEE